MGRRRIEAEEKFSRDSTSTSNIDLVNRRPALEIYFGRFLGLALLFIAIIMLLLTGSIPLSSSTIAVPNVASDLETPDSRGPYAVPMLRIMMLYHILATIYCYTSYYGSSKNGGTGFMLGVVGHGVLAAVGLWCVMFATSRGRISRRTGADKRTSGFPFKNAKAYDSKVDKGKKIR
jgi:hypothetical protein